MIHHFASLKRCGETNKNCSFRKVGQITIENTIAQDMSSADIFSHRKLIFVSSDIRRIFFFVKHEKKGRCFFVNSSKMVRTKVSCITKKYITLIYIKT
jgi:catabolite regulation protein CreA